MERRIQSFVQMYFEDMPYFEGAVQVQSRMEAALNREFEKLAATRPREEALEALVHQYSRLADMAVLAGYRAEDADHWRAAGGAKDLKTSIRELRKQRRRIYGISLLTIAALVGLMWFVYDLVVVPQQAVFLLPFVALFGGGSFWTFWRFCRYEAQHRTEKYDTKAFAYLRGKSDQYAKRLLNGIALLFAVAAIFVLAGLSAFFQGHSKPAELVESFLANILLIEIPLYLCIKNRLYSEMIRRRIGFPDQGRYCRHLCGIAVFSACFWLAVTAAVVAFRKDLRDPLNLLLAAGTVFFVMILLYNLILRRRVTYQNIAVNRARIAWITTIAVCISGYAMLQRDTWYTQPYINSVPVVNHPHHEIDYDDETGVYTVTASTEDFKILHLTDIHLGESLYSYRSNEIK